MENQNNENNNNKNKKNNQNVYNKRFIDKQKNKKFICPICACEYTYYAKSKHLKSKIHNLAVRLTNNNSSNESTNEPTNN